MRLLLLIICLGVTSAVATPTRGVAASQVQHLCLSQFIGTPLRPADVAGALPNSIRLKLLAALAQGDIAGAVSLWQVHTGRNTVPKALQALQAAFSSANRVAGPCARVARDIYDGFKFFGGEPQYVHISSTGGSYLSWQSRIMMSNNNAHLAVRHGGKIYDAFTGPAGIIEPEYLKNIHYAGEIITRTVSSP